MCYFSWPGPHRLLWFFKATELTNTNEIRENTENVPSVTIIYIKYLD